MTALVSACAAAVVAVGSEVMANPEAYLPLDDEPCSCPGCLEGSNDDGE